MHPAAVQPHHVWAKGMGGAGRMDVAVNLIALDIHCHAAVHAGKITRNKLLTIIAKREGTTVAAIERKIYRLRRL